MHLPKDLIPLLDDYPTEMKLSMQNLTHFHSSFIRNNLKQETTQVSVNQGRINNT